MTKPLTASQMARRKWDLMTPDQQAAHIAKMTKRRFRSKAQKEAHVAHMNACRKAKAKAK